MPILTKSQHCAVDILHKLHCVRHSQMHVMLQREFPGVNAEVQMRRLSHLGKVKSDGGCYCWPGCAPNEERLSALDIMLKMSGENPLIYDIPAPPCKLLFFVTKGPVLQAVRLYFPKPGQETAYLAAVETEQLPPGYIAVFYIREQRQKTLLKISRPHIFVSGNGEDGYLFQRD